MRIEYLNVKISCLRAVPFEKLWVGMPYSRNKFHRGWSENLCDSVGGGLEKFVILQGGTVQKNGILEGGGQKS